MLLSNLASQCIHRIIRNLAILLCSYFRQTSLMSPCLIRAYLGTGDLYSTDRLNMLAHERHVKCVRCIHVSAEVIRTLRIVRTYFGTNDAQPTDHTHTFVQNWSEAHRSRGSWRVRCVEKTVDYIHINHNPRSTQRVSYRNPTCTCERTLLISSAASGLCCPRSRSSRNIRTWQREVTTKKRVGEGWQ